MNNKKRTAKVLAIGLVCLSSTVSADMMKCIVQKKPELHGYFDDKDVKQRKKCLSNPVFVVNSNGQKITNQYRNTNSNSTFSTQRTKAQFQPLTASTQPSRCSNVGGTVKVNGRVFNLDPKLLCVKYSTKGSGKISRSYLASHRRLPNVNANFRRKISPYVTKVARKHGMDPAFIHAIISAESAYNPNARSHVGAMGLMQLMPFTAKRFGVSNAYNPHQNIEAGTRYLKILYNEFGSLELAAAGYNAGEGAVRKYNRRIPPYKETRKYVPKVMAFYRRYKRNQSLIALK